MGRCHLHSKKVGVCFDNQRQLHMPTSYSGTSTLLTNSVVFKLLGRVWAALSACRGGGRQQHNPRIILLWPRGQGGAFSLISLTSCQGVGGLESLWRVFCSLEIIQNAITIHFSVVITKPEIRLNHVYKLQEVLQFPRPWPEVRLVKAPPPVHIVMCQGIVLLTSSCSSRSQGSHAGVLGNPSMSTTGLTG